MAVFSLLGPIARRFFSHQEGTPPSLFPHPSRVPLVGFLNHEDPRFNPS